MNPITITIAGGDAESRRRIKTTMSRHLTGCLSRDWPDHRHTVATTGNLEHATTATEVLCDNAERTGAQPVIVTVAQDATKDHE